MPLYFMRRIDLDRPDPDHAWRGEWCIAEQCGEEMGTNTLFWSSALGVAKAAAVAQAPPESVLLRTEPAVVHADETADPILPWMPAARTAFQTAAETLLTKPPAVGEYWLWPSAGGVLSDVPSTQTFFRSTTGFRLFLDPASLLTPAMIPKAEDHLNRIMAGLGSLASAILLANIEPLGDVEGVQLSPVTRGVLSPKIVIDAWRQHVPRETPVVLLDEDLAGQRALLGL